MPPKTLRIATAWLHLLEHPLVQHLSHDLRVEGQHLRRAQRRRLGVGSLSQIGVHSWGCGWAERAALGRLDACAPAQRKKAIPRRRAGAARRKLPESG